MLKIKPICIVLSLIVGLMCQNGCRDRKQGLTLHFVFNDAKGITVGDKVMGDGVFIGQVISQPHSPKPRHVVVSVGIDGLPAEKMPYLTDNLSAEIKKDSFVAGETYLDLIFPHEPGPQVADGAILKGRASGFISLTGISLDANKFLEWLNSLFPNNPATVGATIYYIHCASIVILLLTIIAMILDMLILLPHGMKRGRPSPRLLRDIARLLIVMLVIRFIMCCLRWLGSVDILASDLLIELQIVPAGLKTLFLQEWDFWLASIALCFICLRFKLLSHKSDSH